MSPATTPLYDIRALATRHKISTALVAGLVSTHMASMFGYWDHGIGLTVLDWNWGNGTELLPEASHNTQFLAGSIAHYLNGICFALVYAFVVHPLIPLRNTTPGNMIKALAFGTSLGVMSAGVMTPYVFFPELDPGFFSHNLGFIAILSILVWHWVYGLFLGFIYNPLPDQEVIQSQLDFGQALESLTRDDEARLLAPLPK